MADPKKMEHTAGQIDHAVARILNNDPEIDTIAAERWSLNEQDFWEAVVPQSADDSKIGSDSSIEFWPSDAASQEIYVAAGVYVFSDARAGSFTLMAKNKPSGSITLNYLIK